MTATRGNCDSDMSLLSVLIVVEAFDEEFSPLVAITQLIDVNLKWFPLWIQVLLSIARSMGELKSAKRERESAPCCICCPLQTSIHFFSRCPIRQFARHCVCELERELARPSSFFSSQSVESFFAAASQKWSSLVSQTRLPPLIAHSFDAHPVGKRKRRRDPRIVVVDAGDLEERVAFPQKVLAIHLRGAANEVDGLLSSNAQLLGRYRNVAVMLALLAASNKH